MNFLTSRYPVTLFVATLGIRILFDKKISRRRFATVTNVMI